MANSIQFKSLSGGRARVLITLASGESKAFTIYPAFNIKHFMDVDTVAGRFVLHADCINIGNYNGSFPFNTAEIDKSGSDPVLTSSTAIDLYDEIVNNCF